MIKRIINKVKKIGIKRTIILINEKIYQKVTTDYNITLYLKNRLAKEWKHYWKGYKYLERKYKKKILKLDSKEGTGKLSNKVWWCWLQGEENAPPLQKKCLKSLRENLKDREIIVITSENLYDYIDFPDYIKEKYKKGLISNTHFSDLIRLELLIRYGGTWVDSTAYFTGYNKDLFDKKLFVFKNLNFVWYANKYTFNRESILADSWFITAEIQNPILVTVRDLLFDYWKANNYLFDYFAFHYFFTLTVVYKYQKEFDEIINIPHSIPHLLVYVCLNEYNEQEYNNILKQSTVHKLTHKFPPELIKEGSYLSKILTDKIKKVSHKNENR